MNRFKLLILVILACVLILAGCQSSGDSQTVPETTAPVITDPAEFYNQAAEKINNADQLSYYIGISQTIGYEDQEFTHTSQQHINIENPNSEKMRCSVTEALQFGSYRVPISEIYENGNGYVTLDGSSFTSPITVSDFIRRYAPAVTFTPSLYTEAEVTTQGSHIRIAFHNATDAEAWVMPENATFTEGYGYAELDQNGNILESLYTVSYKIGDAVVNKTTKITMLQNGQVLSPEEPDVYVPIDYFDAPRMLELACGYLLQADTVTSSVSTNINCQTFSISREQASSLTFTGSDEDFYALLDLEINQTNQSRGGEVTQIHQTETFENGMYTISINGTDTTQNEGINAEAMKDYCLDALVGDILLPRHITGATAEEADNALTFTFQASDIFAEAICSKICNLLYSDAELLHALSSSYEAQSLQCVLKVDKITGLPLFFSSEYSALHTIEEISYLLESNTEQTYQYTKISG